MQASPANEGLQLSLGTALPLHILTWDLPAQQAAGSPSACHTESIGLEPQMWHFPEAGGGVGRGPQTTIGQLLQKYFVQITPTLWSQLQNSFKYVDSQLPAPEPAVFPK